MKSLLRKNSKKSFCDEENEDTNDEEKDEETPVAKDEEKDRARDEAEKDQASSSTPIDHDVLKAYDVIGNPSEFESD